MKENKLGQGLSPDIIRTIKTFCKPIRIYLNTILGDSETFQYNDDNIINAYLYMFTYEDSKYLYVDIEGVTAFIFFIHEEKPFIPDLIRKILETIEKWYIDSDTSVFFRGYNIMDIFIVLYNNMKIMLNSDQRGKRSIDITDLVCIEKFPDSVEEKKEEKPSEESGMEVEFIDTI